jgi:DNA-binding response OmpR family regulator
MTSILVVEDEISLRKDLTKYLSLQGFTVQGVGSAREMRDVLDGGERPAIVILDVGLPDASGFDLAGEIRRDIDCGIIMLTALGEGEDRIRGFESGADIYLVKHCSLREIEAAVQSLLRRLPDGGGVAQNATREQWRLRRIGWNLVAPNGTEVKLTAPELIFITALSERSGEPCTREELSQLLARPQATWENRHLDGLVNRLRRKIKDHARADIPVKMLYGRGYAFTAPVSIED